MAVTLVTAVVGTAVTSFVTGAVVSAGITGAVATVVGATAGAVVAGAVSGALTDTPDLANETVEATASGLLVNKASNNASIPVIYGTRRVGGTRVFMEVSGSDNKYLHIVLAVGEGEIHSFTQYYLNDIAYNDARFNNKVTITPHTGADDQTVDTGLSGAVSNWTSNHRLRGTAYLYVKLEFDQDAFPSGLPTITADVKGVKVYDPRTSTTAWSDNPALCIRDYLTNERYGRGIPASQIDDTSFTASANYCDENVTIGGVSKKRYSCDGVVNTQSGSMVILKKLLTSCRGFLIFTGGKYKLVLDKIETAVFTFSEDNIVGTWNIGLGNKQVQYNRINANFFNPLRQWQPDIAVVDSPTLRTQDNGLLLEKSIELPFTSDIDRAKMIATVNLNQSRQQMTVEFNSTIEALRCEVGDVVYVKHPTPSWDTLNGGSGKKFRVIKIRIQNTDEVKVSLLEYDANAYDFGTIAVTDTSPNANLPDLTTVVPPSNLTATESLYDTIGSAGVKVRVDLNWTASEDVFVKEYNVEWKLSSDSTYNFLTTTRTTSARLDDVDPLLHDFRVRAVNTIGVSSDYLTLSNFTVAGLTTPPENVQNLSFISLGGYAHLSWDLANDLDVRVGGNVRFRHSSLTSNANWSSSTDIGTAVAGHNTNAVLPLLAGSYMAKFVDSTGNESTGVSSFISTTVPNIVPMNQVVTSTQNPNFAGAKNNMIAVDDLLKFEADTLWDSFVGNFDTWGYIDAMGGADQNGTYEFDNYIDLGSVFTSRVTGQIVFTAFTSGDTIDARTNYMDTWADFDNVPNDINCDLYIASTDDDPASSPTWTDWAKFVVADTRARALKFKLTASSSDPTHQINITGLNVSVDFPDRVQGQRGLQTGASTKNVTYPEPFKVTPSLGLTFVDMHSNDEVVITNETATGFTVGVLHGANYQDHQFNYVARGY